MKIFANIIAASILSLPLFAANLDNAKKNIYDSNIHTADNARMDLQQLNAEKELLEAFEKVSDRKLRDGVIYSLGKLKSRDAYEKILAVAQKELDKCPVAILALAEYGARKSSSDLRDLAGKGSKTAETALWMLKGAKKDLKAYSKSFFCEVRQVRRQRKGNSFRFGKTDQRLLRLRYVIQGAKSKNRACAVLRACENRFERRLLREKNI